MAFWSASAQGKKGAHRIERGKESTRGNSKDKGVRSRRQSPENVTVVMVADAARRGEGINKEKKKGNESFLGRGRGIEKKMHR